MPNLLALGLSLLVNACADDGADMDADGLASFELDVRWEACPLVTGDEDSGEAECATVGILTRTNGIVTLDSVGRI